MTSLARTPRRKTVLPKHRPPPPPEARMDPAIHATQKKRYQMVLGLSVLAVFAAFVGIYAHITLHQVWGLPLFALAIVGGFGSQIWFVVGMVKAARPEKGA
jgi:hypothetical protein